jgi:hypothetical protein
VPALAVKTSLLMTFSTMICKPILRRKHICKNITCGVDQISLVSEVLPVCPIANLWLRIIFFMILQASHKAPSIWIWCLYFNCNSLLFLSLFLFHLSCAITECFVNCAPYGSLATFSERVQKSFMQWPIFYFAKMFKNCLISLLHLKIYLWNLLPQ